MDSGMRSFLRELYEKGEVHFRGLGGSMRPFFGSGTVFVIRVCDPDELKRGDLVLMRYREEVCLHRFLGWSRKFPGKLVTKGDWFSEPDAPWPVSAVLGKVSEVIRNGESVRTDSLMYGLRARLIAKLSLPAGRIMGVLRRIRQNPNRS